MKKQINRRIDIKELNKLNYNQSIKFNFKAICYEKIY